MATLLTLPPEVLQNIILAVDPRDLATLPRCCRALNTFISGNTQLFKGTYLQILDEPKRNSQGLETDWEKGLHDFVSLQLILASYHKGKDRMLAGKCADEEGIDDAIVHRFEFTHAAQTVIQLLKDATPNKNSLNVAFLTQLAADQRNREFLFCNSELFQRSRGIIDPQYWKEGLLSAKMHCLYGVPIASTGRTRSSRTYPYACSKVYDLRNYTQRTIWGPYLEDGSLYVDWEKMEAIMVVIGHNLRVFSERTKNNIYESIWSKPFATAVSGSYVSMSMPRIDEPALPRDAVDPYNVTGTYMRVVCFLDFTELFAYNFATEQPANGEPRPPLDTIEAIRIIVMEVRMTRIEPPGPKDNPSLPVVHFTGTSRSTDEPWDPQAISNIRGVHGTVRLTREGEVRWTTISIFQGEERWRSEGIQVGGVQSARGVLGHWFDKDYDIHGPAGPTAFWKISDEIEVDHEDLLDMIPI